MDNKEFHPIDSIHNLPSDELRAMIAEFVGHGAYRNPRVSASGVFLNPAGCKEAVRSSWVPVTSKSEFGPSWLIRVPNYTEDLNSLKNVELLLLEAGWWEDYAINLAYLTSGPYTDPDVLKHVWKVATASALAKCKAIVQTLRNKNWVSKYQ